MVFLIALGIVGLYAWKYLQPELNLGENLTVGLPAAILAGISIIICFSTYFWNPKKLVVPVILAIHWLISATTGLLIIDTGGISSPFIALWILLGIFSTAFGFMGWVPLLAAAGVFAGYEYVGNRLTASSSVIIISSSLLPILISTIIYRIRPDKSDIDFETNGIKNLANELNEVASKSEVVINAIGDGVIAIDSQGIIQLINPAAQNIIGWGKQDAMALSYRSVLKLVDEKDQQLDDVTDPIRQSLNSNQEIRTNDLILMTRSGKKLNVALVVSPVGEMGSGVIAVFRDVTKEKTEEREQAEFISTASHEMRTPVASIEGYLGLALNPQTANLDDRAREFIQKAQAATQHLGRLFQDLLDVAKSEDGRMSNNPRVVNLVTFVNEIVMGLKPKADEKGLQLIYKPIPEDQSERERIVPPAYSVNLDNDHIREIINNLVENAIKYSNQGEVIVDVNGDDDHVVVSVKDNGIGIPKEDIPHLFQKFYRVENKDTQEIGGTGLGLYLSRQLAEMMGGRMWVESEYQKGSTFYVELPRISSQDAARLAAEQAANTQTVTQNQTTFTTSTQTQPATPPVNLAPPTQQVIEPVLNKVPRGQALTPDQIAAYVAKQRALAQQQNAIQNTSRPQTITVPPRSVVQ